jgi:2,3-dihydroxybenzoate-AMP ligase
MVEIRSINMTENRSPASLDGYVPFPPKRVETYREARCWRDSTFHDVLDDRAAETPAATAVVGPERERSYADLPENSKRLASALRAEGIGSNERVVFQLPNCLEFLEALFACSRIGAIPVMALPRHREAEIRHLLDSFDATAYLTAGGRYETFDFVSLVDDIEAEYPHLDTLLAVTGEERAPEGWLDFATLRSEPIDERTLENIEVDPIEPGLLLLSGGTTGLPKGIPRTHNDYVFQWEHMAAVAGVEAEWVCFPSVPIGHNASLNCIVGAAIWAGATVAIEPELKPEALMALIERENGTYSLPIPTQLVDILEHPRLDEYDLSSLEVLVSGGQKVPPGVVREAVERWGVGFCNIFGMAEGPLVCTRPDDSINVQAETVGTPIADAAELEIVDTNREAGVDRGEAGELAVRGPGYFTGYFRNAAENDENFDDEGWFYTEDVLARREDGNYAVYGRIKDTIIRGGENIYAPAVEDELADHPAVANVALIGVPDERLGERPCAFVEPADETGSLALEDLTAFLAERGTAVFKHPERLEVLSRLPRTGVGKIDKKRLEERITGPVDPGE